MKLIKFLQYCLIKIKKGEELAFAKRGDYPCGSYAYRPLDSGFFSWFSYACRDISCSVGL